MTTRKISNLLALAVLSLLNERPMHPYEVSAVMRQRELATVIKLNFGTLYSVIEALQREELIAPVGTQREGRYPERTVYATTESGKSELFNWLRSLLSVPTSEFTQFAAALAFLGNLPPVEVAALLEEYVRHLQQEMDKARAILERAARLEIDRLFLVEDEYTLAMLQTRFSFIQRLIDEINDGTLTERADGQLRWKIHRPDLAGLQTEDE